MTGRPTLSLLAPQKDEKEKRCFVKSFPQMEGVVYFWDAGGADYDGDGVDEIQIDAYYAPPAPEKPGYLRIVHKYLIIFEGDEIFYAGWSVVDDSSVYAPEVVD